MMLDILWIRENPNFFDAAIRSRNSKISSSQILSLDKEHREHKTKLQKMKEKTKSLAEEIKFAIKSENRSEEEKLKLAVADLKLKIHSTEERTSNAKKRLYTLLSEIPNVPSSDVPEGIGEEDNLEIRRYGKPFDIHFDAKQHFEIGASLGLMDFHSSSKISGSKFALLKGDLAKLERALGQFMLDLHTKTHGYTEVSPPLLVREDAVYGTGNLPKFSSDLFQTTNHMWLIPTAEVPLSNMVREAILAFEDLPLRFAAITPCFRCEAGGAGRDTRGLMRLHQFMKVELVSITTPDASTKEHEFMLDCVETVLKLLEIPFRTVLLCSGEMGFSSCKTYDVEVWLPGQKTYREISSCSNCGDFQARRMSARYRPEGRKQTNFVHTLNASGLAVGRTVVAVIENYQNEDGSITVPKVLRPYMGANAIRPHSIETT